MVDSKPLIHFWIVVGLSYVAHSGCMFVCGRVVHTWELVVCHAYGSLTYIGCLRASGSLSKYGSLFW